MPIISILPTSAQFPKGTEGQIITYDANGKPVVRDMVTADEIGAQDKLTGTSGQMVGFDTDGNAVAQDANYMPLTGGTMTGAITLASDPTANLHAATKQYVDVQIGDINSILDAVNGEVV